ncbi:hypothetical protein ACVBEG_15660 [Pseudomonas sp. GG8]
MIAFIEQFSKKEASIRLARREKPTLTRQTPEQQKKFDLHPEKPRIAPRSSAGGIAELWLSGLSGLSVAEYSNAIRRLNSQAVYYHESTKQPEDNDNGG